MGIREKVLMKPEIMLADYEDFSLKAIPLKGRTSSKKPGCNVASRDHVVFKV
jgi:hypothetical protein